MLGLKVYHLMLGKCLALAGLREKAIDIMSIGGGQLILDAPDLLQNHVACLVELLFFRCFTHTTSVRILWAEKLGKASQQTMMALGGNGAYSSNETAGRQNCQEAKAND